MQITWHGTVFGPSGYAKSAEEYILALHAAGANIRLEQDPPISGIELPPKQLPLFEHLINKRQEMRQVIIYHLTPDKWPQISEHSFGFPYWETSKIPDDWIKQVHQVRAVFLSSFHNIHLFRSSGVDIPLYYVRPCLSRPFHAPSMDHTPNYVNQLPPFRFLSVCTGIERKGIACLLKAFWSEFTIDDPVCLIIKTTGDRNTHHIINGWKQELNLSHLPAPVYIDLEIRSELEMEALYGSSQVFVLATRGEAVGYPVLEAAMRGIPCIVTGWGGHLDFLNEQNSYLIPYKLVPVPSQPYYYGYQSSQLWAEPSIDEMRKIMRHVTTHYEEALGKAKLAKDYALPHFSSDKAAQDIIGALSQTTGFTFV